MTVPTIPDVIEVFTRYFESDDPFREMRRSHYSLLKHVNILPDELTVPYTGQLFHSRDSRYMNPDLPFNASGILSCAGDRGTKTFSKAFNVQDRVIIPLDLKETTKVYSAEKIFDVGHSMGFSTINSLSKCYAETVDRIFDEDEHIISYSKDLIPLEFHTMVMDI